MNTSSESVLIEYSNSVEKRGWFSSVKEILTSIRSNHQLIWRIFYRDFGARYRQSFLGYFWVFLPIAVTTGAFTFIHRTKLILFAETPLPYPLYVLLSMTVWQFFASGLISVTNSLVSSGVLISKINFPKETLVFSSFGQAVIELILRGLLIALVFVLFHVWPGWTGFLLPLILLPLVFLTLGLGFVFSIVNLLFRDMGMFLTIGLGVMMFLTPVVYPPSAVWPWSILSWLNPVSPFIIAVQDIVSKGYLSQPVVFAADALFSMFLFIFGWRFFHIAMPRIIERV